MSASPHNHTEQLTPLLGSLARRVAADSELSDQELRMLLVDEGVKVEPAALEELQRWGRLLRLLHQYPTQELSGAVREALKQCGVKEGPALLAVDEVMANHRPAQGSNRLENVSLLLLAKAMIMNMLLRFGAAYAMEVNMLKVYHLIPPLLVLVMFGALRGIEPAAIVAIALLPSIGLSRIANSRRLLSWSAKEIARKKSAAAGRFSILWSTVLLQTITLLSLLLMVGTALFLLQSYDWTISVAFAAAMFVWGVSIGASTLSQPGSKKRK
jgi:hypothetical protein